MTAATAVSTAVFGGEEAKSLQLHPGSRGRGDLLKKTELMGNKEINQLTISVERNYS